MINRLRTVSVLLHEPYSVKSVRYLMCTIST